MRNTLKIVCNPYSNRISYYFKNEIGQWSRLSGSSKLSRQFYTSTTIKERVKDIILVANEIYNRKNNGLDILFEGKSEDFQIILNVIKQEFGNSNIKCQLGITKIVVVGKIGSGKTTLIKAMETTQGYEYTQKPHDKYMLYEDECNHAEWYEIKGIDLGKKNIDFAKKTIEELADNGVSTIVYCIKAVTGGKMEEAEKKFIETLVDSFPGLDAVVALTCCVQKKQQDFIDEIKRMTDQIKVVQTMADPYKSEVGDKEVIIEPYGLEQLSRYVFERR